MTRAEFGTCAAVLEAGCNHPIPETTLDVWYQTLGDLPVEGMKAAVTRALAERTYPGLPPVGQLRRYATEFLHGQIATPEAAFARMRKGMLQFGMPINDREGEQLRKFLGESIWAVIQGIGGWPRLCDAAPEERGTIFAQFRDGWNRLAERKATMANLPAAARPRVNYDPHTTDLAHRFTSNVPRLESAAK